jgi:uncharacterized integral membrane protein (TIGR00698 family)
MNSINQIPIGALSRATAQLLPGLILTGAVATAAIELGHLEWLQANGISALTLAIVLGMVAGNTLYPLIAPRADPGVLFAKQRLLRLGIIAYGLRLTFQDIAGVGITGVAIDALVLATTFALSWWAGTRLFGLDRTTAMLIGAGSSICGAAAILAAEPVVEGRASQVTVAVATVVVFGTLAIFLYPALYHLNERFHLVALSATQYGIFAGSTIHEVAQVVAAGHAINDTAANTAVITKMVRVMMLAPFLLLLSTYLARNPSVAEAPLDAVADAPRDGYRSAGKAGLRSGRAASIRPATKSRRATNKIVVPWFALGFVAVAGLNSLAVLPPGMVKAAVTTDTVMLAMAMAALGLTTRVSAIRSAGVKPLALASLLFAWLVLGGGVINAGITAAFR